MRPAPTLARNVCGSKACWCAILLPLPVAAERCLGPYSKHVSSSATILQAGIIYPCAILHSHPSGAALPSTRVSVIGSCNDEDGDTLRPEAQARLGASGVSSLVKPFHVRQWPSGAADPEGTMTEELGVSSAVVASAPPLPQATGATLHGDGRNGNVKPHTFEV
jgi:hypothetical protein